MCALESCQMLKMTFFAQPGPYPGTCIPVSGVLAQPFWAGCDSAQSPFPLCLGYKGLSVSWLTELAIVGHAIFSAGMYLPGTGFRKVGLTPCLKCMTFADEVHKQLRGSILALSTNHCRRK